MFLLLVLKSKALEAAASPVAGRTLPHIGTHARYLKPAEGGAQAGWTSVPHRTWSPFLSSDWDGWEVLVVGEGDKDIPLGPLTISHLDLNLFR